MTNEGGSGVAVDRRLTTGKLIGGVSITCSVGSVEKHIRLVWSAPNSPAVSESSDGLHASLMLLCWSFLSSFLSKLSIAPSEGPMMSLVTHRLLF